MKERPDVGVYIKDLIGYVVNNADDMDKIMMVGHKNSKQTTKKLKTKQNMSLSVVANLPISEKKQT